MPTNVINASHIFAARRVRKQRRTRSALATSVVSLADQFQPFSWDEMTHFFTVEEAGELCGWMDDYGMSKKPMAIYHTNPPLFNKVCRYFGMPADEIKRPRDPLGFIIHAIAGMFIVEDWMDLPTGSMFGAVALYEGTEEE